MAIGGHDLPAMSIVEPWSRAPAQVGGYLIILLLVVAALLIVGVGSWSILESIAGA